METFCMKCDRNVVEGKGLCCTSGSSEGGVHEDPICVECCTCQPGIRREVMFEFTKATVVLTRCTDKVILETNFPAAVYPFEGELHVHFDVAADSGFEYVQEHFGFVSKVIDAR